MGIAVIDRLISAMSIEICTGSESKRIFGNESLELRLVVSGTQKVRPCSIMLASRVHEFFCRGAHLRWIPEGIKGVVNLNGSSRVGESYYTAQCIRCEAPRSCRIWARKRSSRIQSSLPRLLPLTDSASSGHNPRCLLNSRGAPTAHGTQWQASPSQA